MITVHHLENSRSQRVLWLLEELELPYRVKRYSRNPRTMLAPAELRAVHPLGKAPVIDDEGQIVAETGAIVEYLVEKTNGRLGPPAKRDSVLRYRFFLHYAEGSLMPPLFGMLILRKLGVLGRPAKPRIQSLLDQHLDWLEGELASRDWFAGDEFSAADVMMSFPLELCRARAGLDRSRPHLIDWLERIHARPGYGTALQKGGPYAYA